MKNWGSLAMNRNLWHAVTQQKNVHCNSNGGGYAWMDSDDSESKSEDTAAERILPQPEASPSSYAGVILGLAESSANALDQQSTQASNAIILPANSNCDHHDMQPTHAT